MLFSLRRGGVERGAGRKKGEGRREKRGARYVLGVIPPMHERDGECLDVGVGAEVPLEDLGVAVVVAEGVGGGRGGGGVGFGPGLRADGACS